MACYLYVASRRCLSDFIHAMDLRGLADRGYFLIALLASIIVMILYLLTSRVHIYDLRAHNFFVLEESLPEPVTYHTAQFQYIIIANSRSYLL